MHLILIQTKEYLLLVNEEFEIKIGGYCFTIFNDAVTKVDNKETELWIRSFNKTEKRYYYNITAYYPLQADSEELDLPLLPSPYQFSLEDIRKILIEFHEGNMAYITGKEEDNLGIEDYIQSLSTSILPIDFIPVYEDVFTKTENCSILDNNDHTHSKKLKTTSKNDKTYLVGEYKY